MVFQPSSVLIAMLGSKPQLVTLTLDSLRQHGELPTRVILVHTRRGRRETDEALGVLESELRGYENIEYHPLELDQMDVTSLEEVDRAFRVLYAEVHHAKKSDQIVHLLIAGGRRTLAVFGMAAAQMLFDDRDRLWHLVSHPALEASGNLHAGEGEWAKLIPIPVIPWSRISPAFDILREVDDPFMASQRLSAFRLREQWDAARIFLLTKVSAAERQALDLLGRDGLNQAEIAERLALSPRTVESHLRSAYRKAAEHWQVQDVNQAQLVRLLAAFYHWSGGIQGKNG